MSEMSKPAVTPVPTPNTTPMPTKQSIAVNLYATTDVVAL